MRPEIASDSASTLCKDASLLSQPADSISSHSKPGLEPRRAKLSPSQHEQSMGPGILLELLKLN